MNNFLKKLNLIILFTMLAGLFSGCGNSEKSPADEDGSLSVFFVNQDNDQVFSEDTGIKGGEADIEKLLQKLDEGPKDEKLKKILYEKTSLEDYSVDDMKTLNLNFDERYNNLEKAEEVLFRMSLVNTFTQLKDISYMSISVNSLPLTLDDGTEVGLMSAYSFIENAGKEISAYSKTTLHLYFADSSGKKLIKTDKSLVYSSNIAMERLVMDNLIQGPPDGTLFPTVSPDTKVNSIDIRDGICYCDLDSAITDQASNVSEEVVFYSLVNSLCEVRGVSKVQISIDGETDRVFREKIELDKPYTRSLELVSPEWK